MRSLIVDLNQLRDGLTDWRLLRVSGSEFLSAELLAAEPGRCQELSLDGFASTRILRSLAEDVVVIVEPEPLAPALCAVHGERFTVGYTTYKGAARVLPQLAELRDPVGPRSAGPLSAALDNLALLWDRRCHARALECVQSEPRLDREGPDYFDAIETRLRNFFSPDHIEIAPLTASIYWPDRPDGWSWIYASRPEYQWPVPLAPDYESTLLGRGTAEHVTRLDEQVLSLPPFDASGGLRSGIFIPLSFRGQRYGVVKLILARPAVASVSELAVLPTLQYGLSLIFDRTAQHLRTQRMAMVDGLTNLFNHRFFLTQLRTEFQRSLRYGGVMTLLMIDVDGFKNYNDTYGHQSGNRVLAWVAAQIRRTVRDIDVVARYGGEEFALILPEVKAEQGLIVAEKIRKVVSSTDIMSDAGERLAPITISVGVTDSTGCKSPEDMIDRADRALYWVKRNGRNLVRLATLD